MKKLLTTLLLTGGILFGQSTTTAPTVPTVSSAATFLAGGVTIPSAGSPKDYTGWIAVVTPLIKTQKIYSISETDYTDVSGKITSSVRSGIATYLRSFGKVDLYGLGDAGIATNGSTSGAAYSGGGIALFPTKWKTIYGVVGVRFLKTTTDQETLFEIGIGKKTQ